MDAMVLGNEDEELAEVDGAAAVFVHKAGQNLELVLAGVVAERTQDCFELLRERWGTLLLMQPSPSLSKRAKA